MTAPARLLGLDVARAAAIAGMFVAHYVVLEPGAPRHGVTADVLRFTDGRAMPLFVLLSGAGFALLTRRRPFVGPVLARAALLLVAGLLLEGGVVAVILHFYAVYFVAGLLVRRLPPWTWLALAVVCIAVGAWVGVWVERATFPPPYRLTDDAWWSALPELTHPWTLVSHLLFTGIYPLFPSFAFFLVGMWLAQRDLRSLRVALVCAVGGTVVAFVAYRAGWATDRHRRGAAATGRSAWRLLGAAGHSNMPVWVVAATAFSVAVVGAGLLVARARPLRPLVGPLAHAGQLALTFYVVHVGLLRRGLRDWPWSMTGAETLATVAAVYVAFVVAAHLLRRRYAHGPAEALLRLGDRALGRR